MTPTDILAFEARHPVLTPEKGERIRRDLGISPTRYFQLLGRAAASAERRAAARERRMGLAA